MKLPARDIHVENKKFKQLVRRALFAKTKKIILLRNVTKS